ncbi:hypothetical protein BpHYR1_010828 [Brachionus plicatilis]|uniref:Uncharacterized protein n=1 Tax=Brachionus plicatilis TaxID=10195 RepID=A0A3M7QLL1_BRAPC|nr:hypothetical protein BpHYR1_010828 [Brachionus plicatilis]
MLLRYDEFTIFYMNYDPSVYFKESDFMIMLGFRTPLYEQVLLIIICLMISFIKKYEAFHQIQLSRKNEKLSRSQIIIQH